MEQNKTKQINKHMLWVFISFTVILFSTDISNSIAYSFHNNITELGCIRYQIALVIPFIIIMINSYIYLFMYAKIDKNNLK